MNRRTECESVVLTKDEKLLLKKIHKNPHIKLKWEEVENLVEMGLVEEDDSPLPEHGLYSADIMSGTYCTTVFYDVYMAYTHREFSLLALKSVWLPIVVSVITNFATDGIQSLLPLIQQWFASFL